jgi:serine/threonine protein kinase
VTSDGVVGTDGYQAPELLAGSRYTSKIDVYSLGVTLSKLARDAGIDSCEALTEAVREMTNPDPSERCTAAIWHCNFPSLPYIRSYETRHTMQFAATKPDAGCRSRRIGGESLRNEDKQLV